MRAPAARAVAATSGKMEATVTSLSRRSLRAPRRFERRVLARHFKSHQMASFVRQLNFCAWRPPPAAVVVAVTPRVAGRD